MTLREYQSTGISKLAHKIAGGIRNLVFQLATGGGKTIIFAAIASRYIEKNPKKGVLILVHRQELLLQTRRTLFNAYQINPQLIVAGMRYIPPAQIYVGMVESVNRRIEKIADIGLVIIDEAHIASFNKIHQHFPTQLIIGFTATPLSANRKKPMKMYYQDIVSGVDIPQLIAEGHLCQNITYAPKDIVDRGELAIKGGEFEEGLMAMQFSKPRYIHNTVRAYEKWCLNEKTLIFNVNILHSQTVNDAFVKAGYSSKHIDSNCTDEERKKIFQWFKDTPNAVLNNVGIATVGFDEPTIENVIINKATMSMPLWLQMCGRASRPTAAKSAFTIIDMGGNTVTHGDWNQSRDWENIFFNPPKPGDGVAPVKSCPECDAIIPASAMTCPYCGYEYPPKEPSPEEELSEFVMVTKGIDVKQIIENNKYKKEYYPFFLIGEDLAKQAHNTVERMTDANAEFILLKYNELARAWAKEVSEKRDTRIRYNQWHKDTARSHLFKQLKRYFPEWEPSITQSASTPVLIE